MARTAGLPIVTAEGGVTRYFQEIRRFRMLEPQEEFTLAKRWREHGDPDAAHRLVTSHLRLVAKIAMGYRGYGLPISEVISEGNVGLMQAVKRFEPDKGFRLATYAMWWIKAAIQEYILRSWSLVKMGTTANQKKLFFNLRKAKSRMSALEEGDLRLDQVQLLAKRLGVGVIEVTPVCADNRAELTVIVTARMRTAVMRLLNPRSLVRRHYGLCGTTVGPAHSSRQTARPRGGQRNALPHAAGHSHSRRICAGL